ncbi:MAG: hypothetical protein ACYC0H_12445, partial [Solirubrobacteraceae bacterium]
MRTSDVVGEFPSQRPQRRRNGVALLSLFIATMATIFACGGLAQARVAGHHLARRLATKIALALPEPGDITYGVAQVQIIAKAHGARATGTTIFEGNTGGLEIAASSPAWHTLRNSTHVYVVVSTVQSAGKAVRDVYFFITRRRGGTTGPQHGTVSFSIPNAVPQVHSFWVHGVDRQGNAIIFNSVNAISTAIRNWSRYVAALKLAHALEAAIHPVDVNGEFRSPGGAGAASAAVTGARQAGIARAKHGVRHAGHGAKRGNSGGKGGIWQGGQHATKDVIGAFHLIFGTMGDRLAFQSAKDSPLVPVFISKDLNNKPLASRLTALLAQLPLEIPDKYAAAAQEEQKFSKTGIHAPKISSAQVAIADTSNAASQAAIETPAPPATAGAAGEEVVVHFVGSGAGTVHKYLRVGPNSYGGYDTNSASRVDCSSLCASFYASGQHLEFIADPATGSGFQGWQGCNGGTGGGHPGY